MVEKSEHKKNIFGIIQFSLVLCCILLIWMILLIIVLFESLSSLEICVLCAIPVIATILLSLTLIRLTSLHPISLTISEKEMEFMNIYKEKTIIVFSEVKKVKINYLMNMKKFQIYIEMKDNKSPIGIFGVGKNIQNAVIKYSKSNNIPVEEYSYFSRRK